MDVGCLLVGDNNNTLKNVVSVFGVCVSLVLKMLTVTDI
jgi:hypothetical protein